MTMPTLAGYSPSLSCRSPSRQPRQCSAPDAGFGSTPWGLPEFTGLAVSGHRHDGLMQSPSLLFAETVRVLSNAARLLGLEVPAIRSRPRRNDVDRTIRRRPSGEAIVAVRLEGRPFAAVQADLIESFIVANGFTGADASLVRRDLWTALCHGDLVAAPGHDAAEAATPQADATWTRPRAVVAA